MADDLFNTWIPALWTKRKPEVGKAPIFMMHRFLACEPDYAIAARYLQRDLRNDPELTFATWQGLLPYATTNPRLTYVAARKGEKAEELTQKIMAVEAIGREEAEEWQGLLFLMRGSLLDAYLYYGIKPDEDKAPEAKKESKRKK